MSSSLWWRIYTAFRWFNTSIYLDAQRLILLRVLLDGDLKDAMPEGYTSVHETPLCGAALAHARMLELADGFLCDIAAAREPHFRYWATKTGSRLRQAARDYAAQHD